MLCHRAGMIKSGKVVEQQDWPLSSNVAAPRHTCLPLPVYKANIRALRLQRRWLQIAKTHQK